MKTTTSLLRRCRAISKHRGYGGLSEACIEGLMVMLPFNCKALGDIARAQG